MSDDELFIAVLAVALALTFWGGWRAAATRTNPLARPGRRLAAVVAVVFVALGVVAAALLTGADPQVRGSPGLIVLFLAVAAVTLAGAVVAGAALGLLVLDGFVRGRNLAVGWAAAGLVLATGLVNAGASVGRGDTIYTTLGPLAMGLGALLALGAALAAATGRFRAVRLDRDGPAGVRVGGLFVAWGLILGRAVAGDWESARRTWEDFFAYGWPAVVLLAVAVPVEWRLRPTVERPVTSWPAGVLSVAGYVVGAATWIALR